jgi:branched-subunit amino acid transport protein AzlD
MINPASSLSLIIVIALMTLLCRALPFIAFRKKTPAFILYLGQVLPFAIMGMLVVYCLRNTDPLGSTYAIPEILAVALTAVLHKWKHNTLLSILLGTIFYMVLVQFVF